MKFNREEAVIFIMNEIWRNGYEASSTRSLADKLGISRSSLYNTFGSREELFIEALNAYNGKGASGSFLIGPEETVPRVISRQVRKICRARISDEEARGCLAINCVAELVNKDDQLGPAVEGIFTANIDFFEELLTIGAHRKQIADDQLRIKAMALQNMIIGLNVMSKFIRDEEELWATAKISLQALGLYQE